MVAAILVLLAVATGCSSGKGSGSDASVPLTGPPESVGSAGVQSSAPDGFRAVTVTIRTADGGTVTRCLLVADSEALREQGLMGVTDEKLSGYDGMLFVFDADSSNGFWMKNTLIPLSIAFADQAGAVVGTADMVPCPAGTKAARSPSPGGLPLRGRGAVRHAGRRRADHRFEPRPHPRRHLHPDGSLNEIFPVIPRRQSGDEGIVEAF